MIHLVALTLLFSNLVTGAAAQLQDSRTVARKTLPSVVFILTKDASDQPVAEGSGFFIRPGLIATNWHVVSDASKVTFSLSGQSHWYGAVVKSKDEEHDVAILKIVDDVQVASLPLGDSSAVEIGEKVFAVGNPRGFVGTFSEGLVSGIRVMNGIRKIQFTAPISSGSSGGPLLNERGEVVGITAQTLTSAQNINFAVPIGYLKPFLNDPELQQLYDEALQRDLFYTMRNNHRFIDKVRRSIIRGEVQERPGGLTQWHSKYSPYDPDVQQIYERALYSKKIAKDPQVLQIVQSLIKRHIVRRVRQK